MAATRFGSTPQYSRRIGAISSPSTMLAADLLMRNHRIAQLLDGMGKGVVPDIVQQRGGAEGAGILVGDPVRIGAGAQMLDRLAGQMEDPDRVLEAGVPRSRPDAGDEPELLNTLQPQKCLRVDQPQLGIGQRHDVVQAVAQHGRNRKSGSDRAAESRFWMCERCLLRHGERIPVQTLRSRVLANRSMENRPWPGRQRVTETESAGTSVRRDRRRRNHSFPLVSPRCW